MELKSNSSSLSSFEEIILIKPENNVETKFHKKSGNKLTKIFKNDENWNKKIKLVDFDIKENKEENNHNKKNKKESLFTKELYKNISIKPFNEDDNTNNESDSNKKKKKGEMTPGIKDNSKFYHSKFGKNNVETGKKKYRESYKMMSVLHNNTSGNKYYNILKEINKLIKYVNNAQEIFSKKTIKIKLQNNEKNVVILPKPIYKAKSIKKKYRKTILKKSNKSHKKLELKKVKDNLNINNSYNLTILNNENNDLELEEDNPFIEKEINTMELIVEIFKKPSGIRNKDELFFIEHYLMTFENVMKILQQKKLGSSGNDLAKKIARFMQIDVIPKNTVICKLGDDGDKFYVIFQGNVAILIPKEINSKMNMNEYLKHIYKLMDLKEYELALRTIDSNFHVFKNNEILYLKADIEKYLYLPEYTNYKREHLTIKEYMERIEFPILNDNKGNKENKENKENTEDIENKENNTISNNKDSLINNFQTNLLIEKKNSFVKENISPSNKSSGKMHNFSNKNKIKKFSSITFSKLLEFKRHANININQKNTSEFSNLSIEKTSNKNRKFTTMAISWNKSDKKDTSSNINKSSINVNAEPPAISYLNDSDTKQNRQNRLPFKTTKKVLFQNNYNSSYKNINNNEENNEKDVNSKKHNVILWTYFHVTNLIDGQIFGDVALSENNKRRTASIITQENTICGTLDNHIYNRFIKDAQKKIRKNIVHSLLNVNFLKGINPDIFEEHYFNMFKYDCIHRKDYLFKSGEERNSIYIVTSGEIEASINCTIQQLNKILKSKNVNLDDAIKFEERLCSISNTFNHFFKNSQNIYRIKIHSFGCCVGLNEYVIHKEDNEKLDVKPSKDIFYVDAKCISDKAEVYSIDYKLLNNIFKSEKKEKFLEDILKNSEKETLLRIIEIKKNAILERFQNLCDKKFLDYYFGIKNISEETKLDNQELNTNYFDNGIFKINKEKRNKKFNITINELNSSYINKINKSNNREKNQSFKSLNKYLNKDKNSKPIFTTIKSNSSSKTSKIIFDDIIYDLEKEKIEDKVITSKKNKLFNNKKNSFNINDNKSLKEEEKSYSIEFEKEILDNNSKNIITLSNISDKQNPNVNNKIKTKSKFNKIKEIHFDENNISVQNNSKNNTILNKNNKKILLYPILMKKTKSNLETISGIPKNKNIKRQLSKDKLMKHKEDKNAFKEQNSIFSLILNGLPNFNNPYISKNIRTKNCEEFKNAKLIDKNLLKLSKEKSFFYKGCESLLTMNNNNYNNNYIPIIDLLKYDEVYEQKYGFKKRNFSAITKPKISLTKLE